MSRANVTRKVMRLPALRIKQGDREIYSFAVDGKQLLDFTTVSRIGRGEDGELAGYQRPEVLSHIRAIRRYIESDGAMLPNAVVVAFNDSVTFRPSRRVNGQELATVGELHVPVDFDGDYKPALLVDGQQRVAAIRDAEVESFPIAAVGFVADDDEQRSQFILVNNTKPLPKGLIHELIPDAAGYLPPKYARRRLPASVMIQLNLNPEGPFFERIQTPTSPDGYIKDNSILRMIENSLFEGALYRYRDPIDGSGDEEAMVAHLEMFWSIVSDTWPDEWLSPPRKSRLTHGAGIQSLGYVMDALTDGYHVDHLDRAEIERKIKAITKISAWSGGQWRLGPDDTRKWNGLQNTPNDVKLLTNLLLRTVRC
ncbi:DGQHR domain-containing protein DpdB [Gordonia sp. CPCC 205515]|uniref:DGQHR domain-containing protein DpdB n=1 Tax=Gordonia sp. CPCC 205515 TaxID=3140791 RepID=UPI003AF402C8